VDFNLRIIIMVDFHYCFVLITYLLLFYFLRYFGWLILFAWEIFLYNITIVDLIRITLKYLFIIRLWFQFTTKLLLLRASASFGWRLLCHTFVAAKYSLICSIRLRYQLFISLQLSFTSRDIIDIIIVPRHLSSSATVQIVINEHHISGVGDSLIHRQCTHTMYCFSLTYLFWV